MTTGHEGEKGVRVRKNRVCVKDTAGGVNMAQNKATIGLA